MGSIAEFRGGERTFEERRWLQRDAIDLASEDGVIALIEHQHGLPLYDAAASWSVCVMESAVRKGPQVWHHAEPIQNLAIAGNCQSERLENEETRLASANQKVKIMKKLHQSAETVTTGDVSEALRLLFGQPVDEDQADVLVAALPNLSKVMLDLLQCTRDAGKPGIFMRIPGRFDVNAPARITIMNAHPGALCTMQIGYTLWAPADLELDVLLVSAAGDSDHAFAVTDDGLREGRIALGLEASLQPGMLRAMLRLHGLTALVADDRHRCRRATA